MTLREELRPRHLRIGLAGAIIAITGGLPIVARADNCVTHRAVVQHERVDSFELDGVPVNVLRPPGYESSGVRYPVLYLLHGTIAHGAEAWLNDGDVIAFTGGLEAARSAIIVMPGGDWLAFRIDWRNGRYIPDTFMTDRLIPHIDSIYRTLGDRGHRAVAGLSGGGYGALHLAARHPDLFAAVGSFSGSGDPVDFIGPAAPAVEAAVFGGYEAACRNHVDPFPVCGSELCWRNENAGDLAPNLGTVSVYIAIGSGIPCDAEDLQTMTQTSRPEYIGPYNLEPVLKTWNDRLHARLVDAGIPHVYESPACGIHTWRYWNRNLRTFWGQMFEAFAGEPATSFDHRSADPSFSVWDWTFESDPARAPEFLDIIDGSCNGVTLRGSGKVSVTTARCFNAGTTVKVNGQMLTADAHGRITVQVDLGPAHEHEQYTAAARALETMPGYWTTKAVTFEEFAA